MKKIALIVIATSIAFVANAQSKTEIYIEKTPALPRDSCNISKIGADNFKTQVNTLIVQVDNEIKSLDNHANSSSGSNAQASVDAKSKQIAQQYGLTEEDMAKLKDKNTSAEEKKEIANKIMMQQTNMTIDEGKKVSTMSEAGKQAYSEAYATEMVATQMANPQQQTATNDSKSSNQLIMEQQTLMNKMMTDVTKISNLYAAIDNDPTGQQMLRNIDKWTQKTMTMIGSQNSKGQKQMDSLALLIKLEQIKYCDMFTPKYRDALRQHLTIFKNSLPDYAKLVEITNELSIAQTGVSSPPESKDIASLGAYRAYLDKLKDAYKCKLYYPDNN